MDDIEREDLGEVLGELDEPRSGRFVISTVDNHIVGDLDQDDRDEIDYDPTSDEYTAEQEMADDEARYDRRYN